MHRSWCRVRARPLTGVLNDRVRSMQRLLINPLSTTTCLDSETTAELERLEESLWQPDTRNVASYVDAVLHANFHETGRSGRVYTRERCIAVTNGDLSVELPLRAYMARLVAPAVVLATYISVMLHDGAQLANRSSLWVHNDVWLHQAPRSAPRFDRSKSAPTTRDLASLRR